MIVDLTPFNLGKDNINLDEHLYFSKDDLKDTDIMDLQDVFVSGEVSLNSLNECVVSLNVSGKMILPCSRTLKPTVYDFEIDIDENVEENKEKFKKTKKTIDILPIIWENILMEIPIKVINPDAEGTLEKGDGWELITDED